MSGAPFPVIAICGPTASGKTGVAVALAHLLEQRGLGAVAISCDAMQVYRGLPILTNQPSADERAELEHRLVGFVDPAEEFSAGRYGDLAHGEIDAVLADGRVPIVVGGTGLYMRAALCELALRPPVPAGIRRAVERAIDEDGVEAVHARLPVAHRDRIEPRDRKRVARVSELLAAGIEPSTGSEGLWTEETRLPTAIFGLALNREVLRDRIEERTVAMLAMGVEEEVRAVEALGPSRTVRTAHGYRELLEGRVEDWKTAQRTYGRRQMTWMRKTPGMTLIERTGLADEEVADRILAASTERFDPALSP